MDSSPNRTLSSRMTVGLTLALFLVSTPPVFGGLQWFTILRQADADGISGYLLFSTSATTQFAWWNRSRDGCDPGIASTVGRVRRGTITGNYAGTPDMSCGFLASRYSNVAADDAGNLYYFYLEGQLVRAYFNKTPGVPGTPLSAPALPSGDPGSYLEYFDGTLIWARHEDGYSHLYQMPADESSSATYITSTPGLVKKIKGFDYDDGQGGTVKAVAFLTDDGRLLSKAIEPVGPTLALPQGQPLTDCNDFDIATHSSPYGPVTWIYAGTGQDDVIFSGQIVPGKLHRISGSSGYAIGWPMPAPGDFQIVSLAVRNGHVYASQLGDVVTANVALPTRTQIARIPTNLATPWEPLILSGGGRDLQSTSIGLLFRVNNEIHQLSAFDDTISIEYEEPRLKRFKRGDVTNDSMVDLEDVLMLLELEAAGGFDWPCAAAADVNADGHVDQQDGLMLLEWYFEDGPPPPAPGPYECGEFEVNDPDDCVDTGCSAESGSDAEGAGDESSEGAAAG